MSARRPAIDGEVYQIHAKKHPRKSTDDREMPETLYAEADPPPRSKNALSRLRGTGTGAALAPPRQKGFDGGCGSPRPIACVPEQNHTSPQKNVALARSP